MNYVQKITVFMLFLAGMDFFNKYFYLIFLATTCFLIYKRVIKTDVNVIFLALVVFALLFFSPSSHDRVTSMIKPTIYLLAYLTGVNFFASQSKASNSSKLYIFCKVTIILSIAPLVHFLINMLVNLQLDLNRSTIDVWTGEKLSATNQSALTCLAIGVLVSVLFINCTIVKKIGASLILGVLIWYNFILAGRTIFVLMVTVFAMSVLFFLNKQRDLRKKTKLLLYVFLGISVIVLIYENNMFRIQEYFGKSNFFLRFFGDYAYSEITQDSRLDNKIYFIRNFLDAFWGGANIRESGAGYAHDIILDTYDEGGFLALIGMVAFLISTYSSCIRFLWKSDAPFYAKQLIFGVYVAVFLQFMIEPIIQGSPWLFALFSFISGMFFSLKKLSFS